MMDIINRRRSVRSYLPDPVEQEKLDLILRAALQAPSAKNQQPVRLLVIQNRERMNQLLTVSPHVKMLAEAPCAIVVLIVKDNLTAPLMVAEDASAATMNILLEATALGLGSCWCGIYPNQERMQNLRNALEIPDQYEVFSLIPLGYPKDPNALHFIDRYDSNKIFYEKI